MLSTIEAVYYASWMALAAKEDKDSLLQRQQLVDMFWLFALQRRVIQTRYDSLTCDYAAAAPFTSEGKEQNRMLRKLHPNRKDL
jgi:hypothetical protein